MRFFLQNQTPENKLDMNLNDNLKEKKEPRRSIDKNSKKGVKLTKDKVENKSYKTE